MNPTEPLASAAAPKGKPRFSEIDSLRAVACIAVVICHALSTLAADVRFASVSVSLGYFGVLVFFIISGYVVPYSLKGGRLEGVRRFLIRRFWRLYPPFGLALLLAYFLRFNSITASDLALGATMFPSLGGGKPIAGHFWTLEVELAFYLMIAAVFLFLGRIRWGGVLFIYASILSFPVVFPSWTGALKDIIGFFPLMLFGTLCREVMFSRRWVSRILGLSVIAFLICIPYLEEFSFDVMSRGELRLNFPLIALAAIFTFLFWVVFMPAKIHLLAKVGRATYSIYLFHWMIVYYLFRPLLGYFTASWMWPFYVGLAVGVSILVGAVAYRWIEQPSDRIGKRLAG